MAKSVSITGRPGALDIIVDNRKITGVFSYKLEFPFILPRPSRKSKNRIGKEGTGPNPPTSKETDSRTWVVRLSVFNIKLACLKPTSIFEIITSAIK